MAKNNRFERAVRRAGADHLGVPAAMNRSMKGSLKRTSSASMPTLAPLAPRTRRRPEQGAGPGPARQLEVRHHGAGEGGAGQAVGAGHPGLEALGQLAGEHTILIP